MPTLIEEEVFTFDRLSESAKENAREWMRGLEVQDFDSEFVFESCQTAASILGVEIDMSSNGFPKIQWSGFNSQGDGASFVGSYSHAPQSPAKIREEFTTDTALHAIADGLDALQNGYRLLTGNRINAQIVQYGSYYHEYTMHIDLVEDSETGEQVEDVEYDKRILELMQSFARWIYRSLEQEYYYRLSNEAIDERLEDYQFDEDGNRI